MVALQGVSSLLENTRCVYLRAHWVTKSAFVLKVSFEVFIKFSITHIYVHHPIGF